MEHFVFSCLDSRILDNGSLYGRFLLGPFALNTGLTVATTLRRSLLHNRPQTSLGEISKNKKVLGNSKLQSSSIISAEIQGVFHEYSCLPGIRESALDILVNLSEIVLTTKSRYLTGLNFQNKRYTSEQLQHPQIEIGYIKAFGPGNVTAKDILLPRGLYCVNPLHHIATLSNNGVLVIRLQITMCGLFDIFQIRDKQKQTSHLGGKQQVISSSFDTVLPHSSRNTTLNEQPTGNFEIDMKRQSSSEHKLKPILTEVTKQKTISYLDNISKLTRNYSPGASISCLKTIDKQEKIGAILNSSNGISSSLFAKPVRSTYFSLYQFPLKSYQYNSFEEDPNTQKEINVNSNLKSSVTSKQNFNSEEINILDQLDSPISEQNEVRQWSQNSEPYLNSSTTKNASIFQLPVCLKIKSNTYPIEKVNFLISRDEQWKESRDKVIFEVWTNGSVSPRQAIYEAVLSILHLFYSFREPKRILLK